MSRPCERRIIDAKWYEIRTNPLDCMYPTSSLDGWSEVCLGQSIVHPVAILATLRITPTIDIFSSEAVRMFLESPSPAARGQPCLIRIVAYERNRD